ncbi:MAG: hypothetical protein ACFE9L_02340 [Candidatus Hodarchaeota archaeon]
MVHQEIENLEANHKFDSQISVVFNQYLSYIFEREEIYNILDDQEEKDIIYYLIEAKEIVKKWNRKTNLPIVTQDSSISSFDYIKTK